MNTAVLLLSSRKFWVGAMSVAGVFTAAVLCAMKIIPESALIPTIAAVTATGMSFIGATAFESASTDKVTVASLNSGSLPPNDKPR
jgi:hypothetical protein